MIHTYVTQANIARRSNQANRSADREYASGDAGLKRIGAATEPRRFRAAITSGPAQAARSAGKPIDNTRRTRCPTRLEPPCHSAIQNSEQPSQVTAV
jgi:hypothetical protein